MNARAESSRKWWKCVDIAGSFGLPLSLWMAIGVVLGIVLDDEAYSIAVGGALGALLGLVVPVWRWVKG